MLGLVPSTADFRSPLCRFCTQYNVDRPKDLVSVFVLDAVSAINCWTPSVIAALDIDLVLWCFVFFRFFILKILTWKKYSSYGCLRTLNCLLNLPPIVCFQFYRLLYCFNGASAIVVSRAKYRRMEISRFVEIFLSRQFDQNAVCINKILIVRRLMMISLFLFRPDWIFVDHTAVVSLLLLISI